MMGNCVLDVWMGKRATFSLSIQSVCHSPASHHFIVWTKVCALVFCFARFQFQYLAYCKISQSLKHSPLYIGRQLQCTYQYLLSLQLRSSRAKKSSVHRYGTLQTLHPALKFQSANVVAGRQFARSFARSDSGSSDSSGSVPRRGRKIPTWLHSYPI